MEISITRAMGEKESVESFEVDPKTKNYHYIFKTDDHEEHHNKIISSRPHIATPSFLTSMMMTNQKRLDPVQRTSYSIISSDNVWEYGSAPYEKEVFIELQALEQKEIQVGKKKIHATHCKILQNNNSSSTDSGHDIYLSKHFNIPYLGTFSPELYIQVDHLKSFDADLPQF